METPETHGKDFSIAESLRKVRTKRQLEALFNYLGLRARKKLGQNFLVDHNMLRFIVRAAEVGTDDLVLDIGCGTGLLSGHLAEAAGKVIGIEVDKGLFSICSRYLEDKPNVQLVHGDVLAGKHRLSDQFLDAVQKEWQTGRYAAMKVVSNLPFSIASLVVPNLLESGLPLSLLVVTVQKEVAERMVAEPGSRQYAWLSIVVRVHAEAELVRRMPPQVFWPRPDVTSALVRLRPRRDVLEKIADYERFAEVVRAAFLHRRKQLGKALSSWPGLKGMDVAAALSAVGIAPQERAEHVPIESYIALANHLAQKRKKE